MLFVAAAVVVVVAGVVEDDCDVRMSYSRQGYHFDLTVILTPLVFAAVIKIADVNVVAPLAPWE